MLAWEASRVSLRSFCIGDYCGHESTVDAVRRPNVEFRRETLTMALIEPGMPCGLCGEPIHDPDVDTFCTTAHSELYYHPEFNVLNDAAVHQSCIDSWTERDAFVAFFNSEIRDSLVVGQDGHVRYRRWWVTEVWRRFTSRGRHKRGRHTRG